MKSIAVEFFANRISHGGLVSKKQFNDLLEQAKEMEKQNVCNAWENGFEHGAGVNEDKDKYHGTQYYKEIFLSE
jgi:hypothetical protein